MTDPNTDQPSPEIKRPRLEVDIDQYDPTTISSKGLVILGDKLLVYRRGPEAPTHPLFLDVPGGRTEGTETPFQTYKREVKEEFGLDITPESIVWARKYELSDRPGQSVYFLVSTPRATLDDVVFGDEGIEYMLMEPEEFLAQSDVHQPFKDRTLAYLNSLV